MIARACGHVVRALGETLVATIPGVRVGETVRIEGTRGRVVAGEVVALEGERAWIAPFGFIDGIGVGDRIVAADGAVALASGAALLGRAIDAAGTPLDGGPPLRGGVGPVRRGDLAPNERRAVDRPFWTGVPVLDALLTIGRGARVGIFGAPGAGKSSLLDAIVGGARADALVVALIGERGREAERWLARLDARTTIVCATSDRSASERIHAAGVAMAHACELRSRGLHVLLVVDSLARYAAALRERRTALGEPAGRGGYPPGVWFELARFLERAGAGARGSVTTIATVLSDGADEREPLSDAARSLLDGHVALSPELARAGRFPAVDVLASASRTMRDCATGEHVRAAARVRSALARLAETRDARELGFGGAADPAVAAALAAEPEIEALVRRDGPASPEATCRDLGRVARLLDASG